MFSPDQVRKYYDTMTASYLQIYGEVIQAFRPGKPATLLHYIAKSSGLKYGMRILDAGCGVCGPAIFFAKEYKVKVDAVTISPVQVAEARRKIAAQKIQHLVQIKEGDYHQLTSCFEPGKYDAVYFLESLGHSNDIKRVISASYEMLKNGGYIYIKDFYRKISYDTAQQKKTDAVIESVNQHYQYNTLDLNTVVETLRSSGFEIVFIKRFDFKDDISVRFGFEKTHNIDIFEGQPEFYPAEWLEIKCLKP